jgi:hypothetical protein
MLNSPDSAYDDRIMLDYAWSCRLISQRPAGKMLKNAKNVPHVPRKCPNFPENAQNPEKVPNTLGMMPEFSIYLMPKAMPAYFA